MASKLRRATAEVASRVLGSAHHRPGDRRPPRHDPTLDSIEQLRNMAKIAINLVLEEHKKLIASPEGADRKMLVFFIDNAVRVLKEIAPYEYAKLATVTHRVKQIDLDKLDYDEITALESIVTKSVGLRAADDGSSPDSEGETQH